ncbi:hypothetical protein Rhe02_31670 [Rhizocola hellebori]|uniref:Uncharacterized protein n=1 Tax=Rhizocola hellebori TaxID=1392758 RepID=A0A8J3Q776_9ACTN|nr:hypothetical protein [Rhizocola hellebori]GIH05100.1 hypothetical protein Rhe02_31670 [Rhizocola hellebori]
MSGTIAVTPDKRWSAQGWLFDWTLESLARDLSDETARQHLREIVDENIGWLGLADLPPAARAEAFDKITTRLVQEADTDLPGTLPNRPAVLDLLRDLARMAAEARGS